MKRSVGIIGTGRVRASVALCTLHSGVVDELLLNDLKVELAEGEAMDMAHGAGTLLDIARLRQVLGRCHS